MRLCLLLLLVASAAITPTPAAAQDEVSRLDVKSSAERPDLAVEWENVAQLKIASRKLTYRVGEMISIDIAMLNRADEPIFFRPISHPNFRVAGDTGRIPSIMPYGVAEVAFGHASYELVEPDDLQSEHVEILAGCDERAYKQPAFGKAEAPAAEDSGRAFVESERFVTWGDACLRATRPGTYDVSVIYRNEQVVTLRRGKKIKTAVGTIKSNPLSITIVE